ncbi:MAG: hypothetical protein ACOZAN_01615 [Patescibacteria group bacterium]
MLVEQREEPIFSTIDSFRQYFKAIQDRGHVSNVDYRSRPNVSELCRAAVKSMITGIEIRPEAQGLQSREIVKNNEVIIICQRYLLPALEEIKRAGNKHGIDVSFITIEQVYSPMGVSVWRVHFPGDESNFDLPFAEYSHHKLGDVMALAKNFPQLNKTIGDKNVFVVGPRPTYDSGVELKAVALKKMKNRNGSYWHEIGQNGFSEF